MFSVPVPVLLVVTATALIAALACALALVAGSAWAPSLLSGVAAGAATVSVLSRLLDDSYDSD
ncbi:hypothetical protein GCM10022252_18330 [Streptosporangium oxazolinicum]|uniref:Uncharacterized protein n=1 Tax=Streptosporangium oxazolinicum TaxID=909287 RepID=A0ABP8AMI1_9ACTN